MRLGLLAGLLSLLGSGEAEQPSSSLTRLPELVRFVEAPYPPDALAARIEGAVVLAIDVGADGEVRRVEVVESAGPDFDRAALEAAAGFVFTPAEAGELGPVPVRIRYRYGFVLRPKPVATSTRAEAREQAQLPIDLHTLPINLLGTVREAGTRRPVSFATVVVSIATTATTTRTSTEADRRGRFALRGVPSGRHVVTVRAPFFERFDTKEEIREGESLEVLYHLNRAKRDPYEVVVRATLPRKEVARRTLTFEEIERLPGTQGDAIRVIQNLPGVARAPFGLGLLVVRGAPPQDTGVFLDGHQLPILFHFGGLGGVTSVVNARMLERIDFLPGGFGPHQGRVSAGAVELESRYARTDRVHGEAVVDIAGASVFIEGPVTDDEQDGAFVLALRRSYIDGVIAGLASLADASVSLAPRYYDYQVRYDRPIAGTHGVFSLLAYGSDDELLFVGSPAASETGTPDGTRTRTYFHRINPRFEYRPDDETLLRVSPIFGLDFSTAETSGDPSGNDLRFELKDWNMGVRVDGTARLAPKWKLRAGGDVLYFGFETDSELPALPRTKDFPSPLPTDAPTRRDSAEVPAVAASLFAELEITPVPGLTIWPGLRLDLYDFHANARSFVDPRLVEGRTLTGADPRLTARYAPFEDVALKAQAGLYQQPPLPTHLYLNADLPLERAGQYSGGVEWSPIPRLSLDVQGFLRLQGNVPRFTTRTEVVDGTIRLVGFVPDGHRRSYGTEVLLKLEKRWGLFGWIAYTLSKSEFRRDRDDAWQTNFFFDQTHNLNVVVSYELGLDWFLSARFRYVTGGALPSTEARWYDADADQYLREVGLDQRRAPPFHQLDVRVDKRWVFDEWYLEAYLDVQNVYDRTNTEILAPTFDFKDEVPIPSLPLFPIFGIKGVF